MHVYCRCPVLWSRMVEYMLTMIGVSAAVLKLFLCHAKTYRGGGGGGGGGGTILLNCT